MTKGTSAKASPDRGGEERAPILEAIKTPLAFLALVVLVVEAVLLVLASKAEGSDRTLTIVGALVVLLASMGAMLYLARSHPDALLASGDSAKAAGGLPASLGFDQVVAEIEPAIERLERNDYELARIFAASGDLPRLLDGLYSGLLYAAGAVPDGFISPLFYGNLMDWDAARDALRVRYFKGPYNEEIITRVFPLKGPKQGVASAAVNTMTMKSFNSMQSELKEKGEQRLKSMLSIPVDERRDSGTILAINVDCVIENAFPTDGQELYASMESRGKQIAALVKRVNTMRRAVPPSPDRDGRGSVPARGNTTSPA